MRYHDALSSQGLKRKWLRIAHVRVLKEKNMKNGEIKNYNKIVLNIGIYQWRAVNGPGRLASPYLLASKRT